MATAGWDIAAEVGRHHALRPETNGIVGAVGGVHLSMLTINLVSSTLVFWLAARLYLMPRLPELAPRSVLVPILLLHGLRHLGLMFLSAGATYPGIPGRFAYPAALGDLVAAVLAIAAIQALATDAGRAKPLVWIFNVWGSADLAAAITLATVHDAEPFMGAAYWIPAFWVPALLVTHWVTFIVLARHWSEATVAPRLHPEAAKTMP